MCTVYYLQANHWAGKRHDVYGQILDPEGKVVHNLFGKWNEALYCGHAPSMRCIWRPGNVFDGILSVFQLHEVSLMSVTMFPYFSKHEWNINDVRGKTWNLLYFLQCLNASYPRPRICPCQVHGTNRWRCALWCPRPSIYKLPPLSHFEVSWVCGEKIVSHED